MLLLFLSALLASANAAYEISVYADVHKDVEFFTRTFPWIIDNIGGDLIVDYSLLGSGRYSVPQMCALQDLKRNTFLQAQYLKCEAEGKSGGYCLCEAGIDSKTFRECVASGGYLAGLASTRFSELGINFTPIIEIHPNRTVYNVEDISFLEKICTTFGDNLPRGCVHYSNRTESFSDKKALAQFDSVCKNEFPIRDDDYEPVSPPITDPTVTESDWWTTAPEWWHTTTSTPWDCQTAPDWWTSTTPPWSTTSPPWSTTAPPWWTTPPPWSTTSPPWWTTPPPWSTTSPPWSTTPPPWPTTSPWVTQTTPEESTPPSTQGTSTSTPDWWSTTPPPWWTTSPWVTQTAPWWVTTSLPWSTTPPPWPTTSPWVTQTTPWSYSTTARSQMQNEENTTATPDTPDELEILAE